MAIDVLIGGTFDIAHTRQLLRKASDEGRWPPYLRIRSIAALTAMAEVLVFKSQNRGQALPIRIDVVNQDDILGVEFHADAPFKEICRHFVAARWQLERASDELVVESGGEAEHIILRLWAKEMNQ